MTKSAKQDTNEGPAKTAETESAATTDADATESAAGRRQPPSTLRPLTPATGTTARPGTPASRTSMT